MTSKRPNSTGEFLKLLVVPSPNWPKAFAPKQLTSPVVNRTHVWDAPNEICDPLETPITSTATDELEFCPLPN
jgi:hypothetical protein